MESGQKSPHTPKGKRIMLMNFVDTDEIIPELRLFPGLLVNTKQEVIHVWVSHITLHDLETILARGFQL